MEPEGIYAAFRSFLSSWTGDGAAVDTPNIIVSTTAFCIRSFDNDALQFSFPLLIRRDLNSEIGLNPAGSDGAVCTLIERIKERAQTMTELGPLYGKGLKSSQRYHDTIEPYTIIHSDAAIGSHLWKADDRNYSDRTGVHLIIRGALPCPPARRGGLPSNRATRSPL